MAGEQPLGALEFIYAPSADVARDVDWFAEVLGAEVRFAIEDEGTHVAMLRLGDGPPLLLTDHLPDDRPIFLYRVSGLADAEKALTERGWSPERSIELPMGPAMTFRSPGGVRLAIFEATRPFVVDSFIGRRDF